MQTAAPVAMIAQTAATTTAKAAWWWAVKNRRKYFGNALQSDPAQAHGELFCMLLVNNPTALTQAGSFSQYLAPPRLRFRQGEPDRNFPGDPDNDGFVDAYGFQVVRLASGRAAFTIYPQERPLFYPPYLFTVPAIERQALDLKDSRVLINIDGKQFADPPRFPDGSFLLQMPYVINQPVNVEALLIHK